VGLYAYGKIGRSISLTPSGWGVVGGDSEPPRLLRSLAHRNPDDTFMIVSTCRDDPRACGYPPNVFNAWSPERLEWYRTAVAPYQETMRQVSKTDPRMLDAIRGIETVIDALLLPLVEKLDGVIVWAGQHGTANSVLPAVTDRSGTPGFTRPYDSFVFYGGGIFRLVNAWRDRSPLHNEETWLIADARNYLKARDVKWPPLHPVLGQFNFTRDLHHERFGDKLNPSDEAFHRSKWKTDHTWLSPVDYRYSNLEACSLVGAALPPTPASTMFNKWGERDSFGIFINEAGWHTGQGRDQESAGRLQRAPILAEWVLPLRARGGIAFMHGKWTTASLKKLDVVIEPAPWEDYFGVLSTVRSTFTTPSSGSGWATTKPWEAFAAGTVCFRHPAYDTQDHIYGRLEQWAREWLSPATPADLWARVDQLDKDPTTWVSIVDAQHALLRDALQDRPWLTAIEERMHR
jgi:hypothetical protein